MKLININFLLKISKKIILNLFIETDKRKDY